MMDRNRLWLTSLLILSAAPFVHADQPLIVAHRGLLLESPENTLANFRACLELRLGFEVDVQRAKDGTLVCVHDSTLDRTTNGQGKVADKSVKELKSLDAGAWFAAKFAGERIPTFDEVLALVAEYPQSTQLIAVDLKANDSKVEADCVRLAERHKVLDRLLFIGTTIRDGSSRHRLRVANAKTQSAAVANSSDELHAALHDKHARWVYVRYVPSADEVSQVHAMKKRVIIVGTTVAGLEPKNWQAATQAGVDVIMTDYSIELARQLRQ